MKKLQFIVLNIKEIYVPSLKHIFLQTARLLSVVLTCIICLSSIPASASSYSITFYERTGSTNANLFTDFIVSGMATFEINDLAVSANNLVLFSDSDFLAFDAIMTTTLGDAQLTLGIDDFPPQDGGTANAHEQGILFDAAGQPLRFDTLTGTVNAAKICDPTCNSSNAILTLLDDNVFDQVFLSDGTIQSMTTAISNGDAFTPLHGEWRFSPFNSIGNTDDSYYLIQQSVVPIPPSILLFGSGVLSLLIMARRKTYA